jgi:hypothetical protein
VKGQAITHWRRPRMVEVFRRYAFSAMVEGVLKGSREGMKVQVFL